MIWGDLAYLLVTYASLFLLQLIALPLIFYLSNRFSMLKDAAWGFGRIITLLCLAFLSWQLAFLQIPINSDAGVLLLLMLFLLISLYSTYRFLKPRPHFWRSFWQKFKSVIIVEESIFLLAFLFLFVMRSFQPEILGLEKFMDAGFIQAYLKSPTLPAKDIWFALENINYYSFGHFYNAILVHLWRIDLAYAYNLLLMTLFAVFVIEIFSLVYNLTSNLLVKPFFIGSEKRATQIAKTAAVLAIFLVALGANGHPLWYFWQHGSMEAYWYPDATRFITHTIHEFPAYSFVVSDLHAHVLSLPISLLLLLSIFLWAQELWRTKVCPKFLSLSLGFIFGILTMTNTWDIMVYGVLLIILAVLLLVKNPKVFFPLFLSALLIGLMTVGTSFFWLSHFVPISSHLLLTTEQTPFWQLAMLWGSHLLWALAFMFFLKPLFYRSDQLAPLAFLLLAIFALCLFLFVFPEFFYFKDIYKTYPRANTMFKLVFQAFMLLNLLVSMFFSLLLFPKEKQKSIFAWRLLDLRAFLPRTHQSWFWLKTKLRRFLFLYLPMAVFLFFATLVYPYQAYKSYYGQWRNYRGLDGLAWFAERYPEDFLILDYLKKHERKQVNILEAVGESYTEFARISAFSGLPTVLGWRVHEWLWRATWDKPAQRTKEVEKIYLTPTSTEAQKYLQTYQVKYVVLGSKEFEAYPELDLAGLLSLGETVLAVNNHYLIKLFD